jgi:hypothetical protein
LRRSSPVTNAKSLSSTFDEIRPEYFKESLCKGKKRRTEERGKEEIKIGRCTGRNMKEVKKNFMGSAREKMRVSHKDHVFRIFLMNSVMS